MPTGKPGTLTHGHSAYRHGRCRCEVCREAAKDYRSRYETHEDWKRWKRASRARIRASNSEPKPDGN